jgi:hypothetical protein
MMDDARAETRSIWAEYFGRACSEPGITVLPLSLFYALFLHFVLKGLPWDAEGLDGSAKGRHIK